MHDAPWEHRAADQSYEVRGRIVALPAPGQSLRIYHEPIPDFVNAQGRIIGMNAMVMEFPHILPGLDLRAIEVGDVVEFVFDVYWTDGAPAWRVTSLFPLDPDTELDLQTQPQADSVHRYIVRGEIAQLPDPAFPLRELLIRHEAIPTFRNAKGEIVGMQAMVMPFPRLDENVTLTGLEIGSKIELVMRTFLEADRLRYSIESIRLLPPETVLNFNGD